VLLRNENATLPLDATAIRRIAVIGPNAADAQIMGGGSARVNAHRQVSPLDAIRERLAGNVEVIYAKGCTNRRALPLVHGPVEVEYFRNETPVPGADSLPMAREELPTMEGAWFGEVRYRYDGGPVMARLTAVFTPAESGAHRFGIASIGRSQLFLDGVLLIDNERGWTPGPSYFGLGSEELTGAAELVAGRSYTLTVRYVGARSGLQTADAVRVGTAPVSSEGSIDEAVVAARGADVAIVCCGRTGDWDAEGADLPGLELPGPQDELIRRVTEANPRTVVVLQTGGPVPMPWLERVPAVLEAWYPGQECGHSIADVVFGDADPGGRLPQTFPIDVADEPVFSDPPATYPGADGTVRYDEGIFVGYRHFDRRGVEPLFPFGHGLSYATFRYGGVALDGATLGPGESTTVRVEVTNTSDRAGQEVVQLYIADPDASVERPLRELKGYRKLFLAAGETATATLTIDMRALAFFDVDRNAWVAEAGDFEVLVGRSSREICAQATVRLTDTWCEPIART
jgi:beta-glucosidase